MCYIFQRTFKLQIFILHYSFERVIMRLEAITNNMFDVQNIYKFSWRHMYFNLTAFCKR